MTSRPPSSPHRWLASLVRRLHAGGVIAFPTDTVCGLGCVASSGRGVRAIFRLKGRARGKPLIVLVASKARAERIAGRPDPRTGYVLSRLWPGALTAILRPSVRLPGGVGTARTLGVRVPAHRALQRLLRAAGPLATTSANSAGQPPVRLSRTAAVLWPGRVGVLPGRAGRTPSTVVDFTRWPPRILREGAISSRIIKKLLVRASRLRPR